MSKTLFDDTDIKKAADREDQGESISSARQFGELEGLMKDRGISRSDVKDFMKDRYAPVSEDLSISLLTPTMCENLIEDIEEGRLEG